MIPEHLHVVNSDFDGVDILDGFLNLIWKSELSGILSKILNGSLEISKFSKDTTKLLDSNGWSTDILEEFSLLHLLGEGSDLILQVFDAHVVHVLEVLDFWCNLLLDILGNLFEVIPFFADLGEALALRVLAKFCFLEHLEGFFELIDLKGDLIGFSEYVFDGFFDVKNFFDVFKILSFSHCVFLGISES